jgi:hypothetical protein
MSTVSGFVIGVAAAAVLTLVYGEQLGEQLRGVAAGLQRSTVIELTPQSDGGTSSPERVSTSAAEVLAVPVSDVTASAATPRVEADSTASGQADQGSAPAEDPLSELARHWADYAEGADRLVAVGEFPWRTCFQRAAASYDLPEALLLAIARGESSFDPAARSAKDAVGLMQIRWPDTSRDLGILREADLYDPCTNVDAGARYLARLIERYDRQLHLAVAAYNYGPGRVRPGEVPEGARWYSQYIYQHLQQVLGREHVATSTLLPPRPRGDGGHQVLLRFNQSHRARDFIAFLQSQAPELDLQQKSEALGHHEVVLLYSTENERRQAMEAISRTGIAPLALQTNPRTPL